MLRPTLTLFISLVAVAAHAQDAGMFTGRIVSPDGTPIEGAMVTLPDFGGGNPLGEAKAGSDGNFTLSIQERDGRAIHRKSLALRVEADDHAATYVDKRHLTLFPGSKKHLGNIVLDVGNTYSGRIIDHTGQPIAGATVKCGAFRFTFGNTVETIGSEMTVTTDSNGRFQSPLIPLGTPYILVHADGYLTGVYAPGQFASARRGGILPELQLAPDKAIHGVIKTEEGDPIEHVEVSANGITATTDIDGKFVLRGFGGDARFQLQVSVDGYAFVNWGVTATPDGFEYYDVGQLGEIDTQDAETYKRAMKEITIQIPRLEVVMHRESQIRGRVIDAETDAPITISRIVLCTFTRKKDGEIVLEGCRLPRFAQPRPGEFSVAYSYPAEYHIAVSAEGYHDAEAFTPPVTSLQQIDGIVVQMRKKSSASEGVEKVRQQINGVVRGQDQLPAGGRVALWSVPKKGRNAVNALIIRGRTTVGDGYVFASAMLEDGRFSLDVPYQSDDRYVLVETPSRIVSLHGPVSVAKGETKSLELTPQTAGRLRGVVTNHSSLTLPLYAIMFSKLGIQYETRVKTDGSFEFADVYPGTYGLKIGCDSILDTDVPGISDKNMATEERLEIHRKPSQPWRRAERVVVNEGQVLNGIAVKFEP